MIKVVTWNVHFFAKNWLRRVKEVEKVLDCYKNADIMGFQEVGIGGNIEYSHCGKWSKRRGYKADYLSFVPRMKLLHQGIFARILDFFYMINCFVFTYFGDFLYAIFDIYILKMLLLPIFIISITPILTYFLIGTSTFVKERVGYEIVPLRVINKASVNYIEKDGKKIMVVNVHLSPDGLKGEGKRLKEIYSLLTFIGDRENVIVMGDFNAEPDSSIYKIMEDVGFRSAMKEKYGKEKYTFPRHKPNMTLDYIWVRGNQLKVKKVKRIGTKGASDHYGLYAVISLAGQLTEVLEEKDGEEIHRGIKVKQREKERKGEGIVDEAEGDGGEVAKDEDNNEEENGDLSEGAYSEAFFSANEVFEPSGGKEGLEGGRGLGDVKIDGSFEMPEHVEEVSGLEEGEKE